MYDLRHVTPDVDGFAALLQQSLAEGHGMLRRLEENWRLETNTFSRSGEILVGVLSGNALVGICGRNIDPYAGDERTGRVRHLYVQGHHRRHGTGRLLIEAISSDAARYFDHLNARTAECVPLLRKPGVRTGRRRSSCDASAMAHKTVTSASLALPSPRSGGRRGLPPDRAAFS